MHAYDTRDPRGAHHRARLRRLQPPRESEQFNAQVERRHGRTLRFPTRMNFDLRNPWHTLLFALYMHHALGGHTRNVQVFANRRERRAHDAHEGTPPAEASTRAEPETAAPVSVPDAGPVAVPLPWQRSASLLASAAGGPAGGPSQAASAQQAVFAGPPAGMNVTTPAHMADSQAPAVLPDQAGAIAQYMRLNPVSSGVNRARQPEGRPGRGGPLSDPAPMASARKRTKQPRSRQMQRSWGTELCLVNVSAPAVVNLTNIDWSILETPETRRTISDEIGREWTAYEAAFRAADNPVFHQANWTELYLQGILNRTGAGGQFNASTPVGVGVIVSRAMNPVLRESGWQSIGNFTLGDYLKGEHLRTDYLGDQIIMRWPSGMSPATIGALGQANLQSDYLRALDQAMGNAGTRQGLKRLFEVQAKVAAARYYDDPNKTRSRLREHARQYVEGGSASYLVYLDSPEPIPNLLFIPYSICTRRNQFRNVLTQSMGVLISLVDERYYEVLVNGDRIEVSNRADLSDFLQKHLPLSRRVRFRDPMDSTGLRGNNRARNYSQKGLNNRPRLRFEQKDDPLEALLEALGSAARTDMDYMVRSPGEASMDWWFALVDSIGTMLSLVTIPVSFGISSSLVKLYTSSKTQLLITLFSATIPKLIQAETADRPQLAEAALHDAFVSVGNEALGNVVGRVVPSVIQAGGRAVQGTVQRTGARILSQVPAGTKTQLVKFINEAFLLRYPFLRNLPAFRQMSRSSWFRHEARKVSLKDATQASAASGDEITRRVQLAGSKPLPDEHVRFESDAILSEWLPNSVFTGYTNIHGKGAVASLLNELTDPQLLTTLEGVAMKDIALVPTDLRGIVDEGGVITVTDFMAPPQLLNQQKVRSYPASALQQAAREGNRNAHWSPRLETRRHEYLRTLPQTPALAEEISRSESRSKRFRAGYVAQFDPNIHLHVPLVIAYRRRTPGAAGDSSPGGTADRFRADEIVYVFAPNVVLDAVTLFFETVGNRTIPVGPLPSSGSSGSPSATAMP
ncbi:hypothetical protein [Paraburkholderia aspalathi]|uniref:hypothetical protein n=1 Tax=Paraburkholderia aspalathi TaxID=1324617 RepID=UPI0038BA2896